MDGTCYRFTSLTLVTVSKPTAGKMTSKLAYNVITSYQVNVLMIVLLVCEGMLKGRGEGNLVPYKWLLKISYFKSPYYLPRNPVLSLKR